MCVCLCVCPVNCVHLSDWMNHSYEADEDVGSVNTHTRKHTLKDNQIDVEN